MPSSSFENDDCSDPPASTTTPPLHREENATCTPCAVHTLRCSTANYTKHAHVTCASRPFRREKGKLSIANIRITTSHESAHMPVNRKLRRGLPDRKSRAAVPERQGITCRVTEPREQAAEETHTCCLHMPRREPVATPLPPNMSQPTMATPNVTRDKPCAALGNARRERSKQPKNLQDRQTSMPGPTGQQPELGRPSRRYQDWRSYMISSSYMTITSK